MGNLHVAPIITGNPSQDISLPKYSGYLGLGLCKFYPCKEDGYWGVKSNEEWVVSASYDSLLVCTKPYGIFGFEQDGKWGVFSLGGLLIPAKYDHFKIGVSEPYCYGIYSISDKWGITSLDGRQLCSAKYDNISLPLHLNTEIKSLKTCCYSGIDVFLAKKGDEFEIICANGLVLLQDINNAKYISLFQDNYSPNITINNNKVIKNLCKDIEKCIKSRVDCNDFSSLIVDLESSKYQILKACNYNGSIPKRRILVNGDDGYINDLGIIDITIDASIQDMLRRDSTNIVALCFTVNQNPPQLDPKDFPEASETMFLILKSQKTLEYCSNNYQKLLELIEMKGLKDNPIYDQIKGNLEAFNKAIEGGKKAIKKIEKSERIVAKINKMNQVVAPILMNIATIAEISANVVNLRNSIKGEKGSESNFTGYSLQQQYKMWEQRAIANYNSLTNLGVRVKRNGKDVGGLNGQSINGGNYTIQKQQLREAQREMKNIRNKARNRGITIQKSKYEDVVVGY